MILKVDRPRFTRSERILFTVTVQNRSTVPVDLATPLTFGHTLFAKLEDEKGPVPASGSMVGIIPGPDRILRPGESLAVKRDLMTLENITFASLSAGHYKLRVCYVDPRADDSHGNAQAKPVDELRPKYLSSVAVDLQIGQ